MKRLNKITEPIRMNFNLLRFMLYPTILILISLAGLIYNIIFFNEIGLNNNFFKISIVIVFILILLFEALLLAASKKAKLINNDPVALVVSQFTFKYNIDLVKTDIEEIQNKLRKIGLNTQGNIPKEDQDYALILLEEINHHRKIATFIEKYQIDIDNWDDALNKMRNIADNTDGKYPKDDQDYAKLALDTYNRKQSQ